MGYKQDNWVKLLPYAEYAYNSKTHLAYEQSLIRVAFGTNPKGFDGVLDEYWLCKLPTAWVDAAPTPDLRQQVAARLTEWADMSEAARHSLLKA
jgi:hypothetical protein